MPQTHINRALEVAPAASPEADVDAVLGQLALLGACQQGLPAYYRSLLTSDDEILRVAAVTALLELNAITPAHWDLVLELCRYDGVRTRAFKHFMARLEYKLAAQVAAVKSAGADALRTARMSAECARDLAACLAYDRSLFFETCSVEHLYDAQRTAETLGGWRAVVEWAVRCILVQPAEPRGPYMLFNHLREANQTDRIASLCKVFEAAGVYPRETAIFGARVTTAQGKAKDAVKTLNDLLTRELPHKLKAAALRGRAEAFEALGQFRTAFSSYEQMNAAGATPVAAGDDYISRQRRWAALDIGPLPTDERNANHFMMVGFPRSGTTLLENALAAHPLIETFEEIPSLVRALNFLDLQPKSGPIGADIALEARQRYYEEIDRNAGKASARVFVDKLPVNSAAIKFLEKLFAGKRYVFSIRHPHDVVLSCFKQHFAPNRAMENFRRFPDACRLYDFAMSQWFDVFTLGDIERVRYVRYEELVNDFQATTTRVLGFLGVDWNDNVLNFAERAEGRRASTPSYQKVRAGLSVGVQSSWRNYAFLFETPEAAVLKRWVKHFGYDG